VTSDFLSLLHAEMPSMNFKFQGVPDFPRCCDLKRQTLSPRLDTYIYQSAIPYISVTNQGHI